MWVGALEACVGAFEAWVAALAALGPCVWALEVPGGTLEAWDFPDCGADLRVSFGGAGAEGSREGAPRGAVVVGIEWMGASPIMYSSAWPPVGIYPFGPTPCCIESEYGCSSNFWYCCGGGWNTGCTGWNVWKAP